MGRCCFPQQFRGSVPRCLENARSGGLLPPALELKPDFAEAHNNLGIAFQDQGKLDEAGVCYRRALELKPNNAEAYNNLGTVYKDQGEVGGSGRLLPTGMELKPDYAKAHNNFGNALKDLGKLEEAGACYRRALELKPDYAEAQQQPRYCFQRTRGTWRKRSHATVGHWN